MLEDPIQMPKTVTCGPFQIHFYKNLFPHENSYKKLTNSGIETLLNNLFTLVQEKTEQIINEYAQQRHINMTCPQ